MFTLLSTATAWPQGNGLVLLLGASNTNKARTSLPSSYFFDAGGISGGADRQRTNPHTRKRIRKGATIVERDFILPTSASVSIQRRSRKNAHLHKRPHRPPSQTPMPLREDLEGTKKTGDILAAAPVRCPIDCAHNMPQPVCQRPSQRLTKKKKNRSAKRKTRSPARER